MEQFGMVDTEFLKSLMKVKGLSEREFADLIGVSHAQMNRVMNQKRNAGNKFIKGVLSSFPDVSYGQLFSRENKLPKGNGGKKKTA